MLTITAHASGVLNYWYSNGPRITSWEKSSIDVYTISLNSSFISMLNNAVTNGVNEWSSASIPVSKTTSYYSAEIKIYGGLLAEIQAIYPAFSSTSSGLCEYASSTYDETYYIAPDYAIIKTGYTFNSSSQAKIYIRQFTGTRDWERYYKTATHEIGHGIGWNGHSIYSTDVMYAYSSMIYELTNRDEDHIKQAY